MSSNTGFKEMEEKTSTINNPKSRDYSLGIDLLNDNDKDVLEFIRNRIEVYGVHEHQGEDLWWDFYDDFKEFTKAENFLRAGTELPRRLRDVLRKRGVYIPKDKKSIAGNLVALLNFNEPPLWPPTDKEYDRIMGLTNPYFHPEPKSKFYDKKMESKRLQNVKSREKPDSSQDFKSHNNQSWQNGSSSLNQYSNNPEKILSIEYVSITRAI